MKDELLLKLVSHFLAIHPIDENKPENLLKFARALFEEGYSEGYSGGFDNGYVSGTLDGEW